MIRKQGNKFTIDITHMSNNKIANILNQIKNDLAKNDKNIKLVNQYK